MPSDATIPYGFKVSQRKAKEGSCQLWGAPTPRDFQKNQEGGGLPGLLYSIQEEGIKTVFSYSLSRQCGDRMGSSNC